MTAICDIVTEKMDEYARQLADLDPAGHSSVKKYVDAGFTEVALVQVGQNQAEFCDLYARELGPTLHAL